MMGRTNWRAGARAMAYIACPSATSPSRSTPAQQSYLLHGMTTMKATLNAPHGIIYSFKIIGIRGRKFPSTTGLAAVKCLQAA